MSEPAFPTVSESLASDSILSIYSDIKSTMGIAQINLVWRHLAIVPAVLDWSWHTLKPHYCNSSIQAAAWLLRESLEIPVLDLFTEEEQAECTAELRAATTIDTLLSTYVRANAQNLVAMCYLQKCLAGVRHTVIDELKLNSKQQAAELADQVTGTIPPLPDPETLDSNIKAAINAMTRVWVPSNHKGFQPSLFRHIAYWPTILQLYQKRLTALQAINVYSLSRMTKCAVEHAKNQVANIETTPQNIPSLTVENKQWLQSTLDDFIHDMIAPGVVIVPAMRAVLSTTVSRDRL